MCFLRTIKKLPPPLLCDLITKRAEAVDMYLNCKTFFSLRYGTINAADLVKKAKELGITSLALTNINITSDAWEFVQLCHAQDIKPIIGVECRNEHTFKYILLAHNLEGWFQINRFVSTHLHTAEPYPDQAPFLPHTFVIYAWDSRPLSQLAPHELMGVRPREINKLFRINTKAFPDKLVVLQPVTFQNRDHYILHCLLRAVDQNILISQLEQHTVATADEQWMPPSKLLACYENYPHIVRNTLRIMEACEIRFDFTCSHNKKCYGANEEADRVLLRQLAFEGMAYRYGNNNEEAHSRIEKELQIITQLNFNAYFLITWDIIRYAQHRNFFYVGRGSGANSVVAYCLKITDVDPIELDLYFERFLNPHRSSPPDFDIDFSWRDRDEIIKYVFDTHRREHTALLGTVATFQTNAMIRELGKVYGLPKNEIDKILENQFDVRLDKDNIQQKILKYVALMDVEKSFPNHLSIHAGGILISEAPIHQYCTTHLPPKGFSTAQLDMHQAEAIGLFKFDILSQRGLGHIRDAIDIIKQNKGVDIDIHDVKTFMVDPSVKNQLKTVNTIGCFYIESPAMRQLLKKLECDDYLTLVAASSIIRPGVAQSGMMRQYIHNFRHPQQVEYLHPIIKELLHETFGIMVYQEDVIKVAHRFANLELADADTLRRAMSGKYRGQDNFLKIQKQFFDNCDHLGHPKPIAEEVWRQISSFANFSFSKAHSASFAVESYQSLFLKTYFPSEFMVAVINNFGGFYNRELYFRELQNTGVQVYPPCANNSGYYTQIKGKEVYTGFIHVEGLEQLLAERLLENRDIYGAFADLDDFISRIAPAPEQLEILIRIGCFNFTGHTKKELLWKSSLLVRNHDKKYTNTVALFQEPAVSGQLPALAYHDHENAFDEIELLGFSISSPFEVLQLDQSCFLTAKNFAPHIGHQIQTLGYLVCTKYVRTSKGEPMCFGTFLDREGQFIDTVHFPDSLRQYPVQKGGFYILHGKVIAEYGVLSMEINYLRKVGYFEKE
jgi:DNA-directed DNA polymerase III PolC